MLFYEARKVIVSALVGSHNYNLETENSDKDYKYFVFPLFEDLYFGRRFSTAKQGEGIDYDVHDIRSLPELIWKSNINFIEVLFSKELTFDSSLAFIFSRSEELASMNLPAFWNATYGMHVQKMNSLFKGTAKTTRLVQKFGYDTKQAHHALRLLYVLKNYALSKSMLLSFRFGEGEQKKNLMRVKNNQVTLDEFYCMVDEAQGDLTPELKQWYQTSGINGLLKIELEIDMMNYVKKAILRAE